MKILFLHKDPKKCAEMHVDEEVIAKIPQYCRLLSKSLNMRNSFVKIYNVKTSVNDLKDESILWLCDSQSHRSYLFNLIRHLIKEYDKRWCKGFKFISERKFIEELKYWTSGETINWSKTRLA